MKPSILRSLYPRWSPNNYDFVYLQMEKAMTTTRMATLVMSLLTNFPDPSMNSTVDSPGLSLLNCSGLPMVG